MPLPPQPGSSPYLPPAFTPLRPARLRVTRNLQTLGILWCLFGAYRIIGGLIGMFVLRAVSSREIRFPGWPFSHGSPLPQGWMGILVPVIAAATVASSILAFITAYGLLTRRPWGRTLAIIAGVITLLKFPMGTGLGIYTLWVLAPGESGAEYDSIIAPIPGL